MFKIAAVQFHTLPIRAAFGDFDPKARLAVHEDSPKQPLLSLSPGAFEAGLRLGMPAKAAMARLHGLSLAKRQPKAEAALLEQAGELLYAFSPRVECLGPDRLLVLMTGTEKLMAWQRKLRTEAELLEAIHQELSAVSPDLSLALADTTGSALSLVHGLHLLHNPQRLVSGTARDGDRLSEFPIEALGWTDPQSTPLQSALQHAIAELRQLGIRSVGALQELGRLDGRFGEAGALLQKRAQGLDNRPLTPFSPPHDLIESHELRQPTEALEPILFILKAIFHAIALRLSGRHEAMQRIQLRFALEPSMHRRIDPSAPKPRSSRFHETLELRFARPTRDESSMLRVAQSQLSARFSGRVLHIQATALDRSPDPGAQLGLFSARPQELEKLGLTLSRLQARFGSAQVLSPKLKSAHRPENAWAPATFQVDQAIQIASAPIEKAQLAPKPPDPSPNDPKQGPKRKAAKALSFSFDASQPWPKAERPALEPEAELPPRPLRLLAKPERIRWGKAQIDWRGQRLGVHSWSGRERLDAEWWTESPLRREYLRVKLNDGRQIWVFQEGPCRYVHGLFD